MRHHRTHTGVALALHDLVRSYRQPRGEPVHAVEGVTLEVPTGQLVAVVGPSGSGKSTLLHCSAGLDEPTAGQVVLAGTEITSLSAGARAAHRARHVGFVFQDYNLITSLTVRDNIALPARLSGRRLASQQISAALDQVGLAHRARQRPHQLSGGERQRVAVARVLAASPDVVFADEPTGALDVETGERVLDWLVALPSSGSSVVMVTHDPRAAARADHVVVMASGAVREIMRGGDPEAVATAVLRAQGGR